MVFVNQFINKYALMSSVFTLKSRLRIVTLLCFLTLSISGIISTSLFAQSTGYIEGKIINSATLKAVAFATIKLKNNQLGVYANADGDFMVSANPAFQNDSLMITCIGYKQSIIAYKELS